MTAPQMPANSGSRESPEVKNCLLKCFSKRPSALQFVDPGKLEVLEAAVAFAAFAVDLALDHHVHIIVHRQP